MRSLGLVTSDGLTREEIRPRRGWSRKRLEHTFGGHGPGRDRVDPNAVSSPLEGQCSRERVDSALGAVACAICGQPR
jgi:hypothetical protein